MKTYAWLILTALSLSACADSSEMRQKDLALACEFRKCGCAPDNQSFAAGQAVQWQQDGSAFCPTGFHLRLLEKPPCQRMTTGLC